MSQKFALIAIFLVGATLILRSSSMNPETCEPETIQQAANFSAWTGLVVTRPLEAFSAETLEVLWNADDQHPSFPKIMMGLSIDAVGRWTGNLFAARLANLPALAILVFALWHWAGLLDGDRRRHWIVLPAFCVPTLIHAGSLATIHFWFAALWWLALVLWARRSEWPWARTGFCLLAALLLGTKVTALQILAILAGYAFWRGGMRVQVRHWLGPILVGIAAYLLVWPWLWPNPPVRLFEHLAAHHATMPPVLPSLFTPDAVPWLLIPPLSLLAGLPLAFLALAVPGARAGSRFSGREEALHLTVLVAVVPCLLFPVALSGEAEAARYLLPSSIAGAVLAGRGLSLWVEGRRRAVFAGAAVALYLCAACLSSSPPFRGNLLYEGFRTASVDVPVAGPFPEAPEPSLDTQSGPG